MTILRDLYNSALFGLVSHDDSLYQIHSVHHGYEVYRWCEWKGAI